MIKNLCLLCLAGLLVCPAARTDEIKVTSKVDAVTLFQQQAEVKRTAKVQLPAGRHAVIFEDVPQSLNADSLQVAGKGGPAALIEGAEFKTVYLQEDFSKEAQMLEEKIRTLEGDLKLAGRNRERAEAQRKRLQDLSLDLNVPADGDKALRPRSAKEMGEILSFSTEALTRLDGELRAIDDRTAALARQIEALKSELAQRKPQRKTKSVVEVALTAGQNTDIILELTYQIGAAFWKPAYNISVDGDKNSAKFSLETFGLISQRTGEDWENVSLTLSTARPQISLQRPQPQPRILDVQPPIPVAPAAARKKGFANMLRKADVAEESMMLGAAAPQEAMEPQSELEQAVADLTISAGVVSYRVPGRVTLKSDGSQEKIKVAAAQLEGKILNVAVPALTQHVYREATLKNTSGAPLLPGPVNILSDGKFTGKQLIQFTQRDRELKLPVGLSEEVLAERKLVKRFEEDPGIVRSYRKISSRYAIELENLSSAAGQVAVLEPDVVSRNEKIKVSRIEEDPKSVALDNEKRLYKETGVTEWQVELKPGEKKTLTYEVSAEFPADLPVSGLEGF